MDAIVSAVPVWGLVALTLLAVVQITLDVIALVDLYRRPTDQVVFANKWIWGRDRPPGEHSRRDHLPGGRPQARRSH